MSPTVCVLGSANMDLVATCAAAPGPGQTVTGTTFTMTPGGKGLNQAVAAARAGAQVAFVGAVGPDAFGEQLRRLLTDEGIDTGHLLTSPVATGIAHIVVTEDGENRIVVVPGSNAEEQLLDEAGSRIAASSYLLSQLERPRQLVQRAFAHARAHGVRTVLTPAPVSRDLDGILEFTDVAVPNAGEGMALTGTTDARQAAARLSEKVGSVVLTLGPAGALVARGGQVVAEVPAPPVDAVVDTTGAGDTLAGVLTARLAAGDDLVAATRVAVAAASLTVTRHGAAAALPSREEMARLVASTSSGS